MPEVRGCPVTIERLCLAVVLLGAVGAAPAVAEEDEVLVAVLHQVAEALVEEGGVACLAVDPGGAPQSIEPELLESFADLPFVRRGAECEERPEGAVELATDRPAVLITAGPIEWVEDDEAWVTVRYFRTAVLSAQRLYRVVREESGWVSLGQIVRMAPA
jgi:hypothetical protein